MASIKEKKLEYSQALILYKDDFENLNENWFEKPESDTYFLKIKDDENGFKWLVFNSNEVDFRATLTNNPFDDLVKIKPINLPYNLLKKINNQLEEMIVDNIVSKNKEVISDFENLKTNKDDILSSLSHFENMSYLRGLYSSPLNLSERRRRFQKSFEDSQIKKETELKFDLK